MFSFRNRPEELLSSVPAGLTYVPAEINPDATLEDFAGQWTLAYFQDNEGGIVYAPLSFDAAYFPMAVEGLHVSAAFATGSFQDVDCVFSDGMLSCDQSVLGDLSLALLKDGKIALSLMFGDTPYYVLYYVRSEAGE